MPQVEREIILLHYFSCLYLIVTSMSAWHLIPINRQNHWKKPTPFCRWPKVVVLGLLLLLYWNQRELGAASSMFSSIPFAHNRFQLVHPLFYLLAPGLYIFVWSMSVLVFLDYYPSPFSNVLWKLVLLVFFLATSTCAQTSLNAVSLFWCNGCLMWSFIYFFISYFIR